MSSYADTQYPPLCEYDSDHPLVRTYPIGWKRFRHPVNGENIYYWNRAERIVTKDNLKDADVFEALLSGKDKILRKLQRHPRHAAKFLVDGNLSRDWDLIMKDGKPQSLISWREKQVYEFATRGEDEKEYVEHQSSKVYWQRVAEFPCHHTSLPKGAEQKLANLTYNSGLWGAVLRRGDNRDLWEGYRQYRNKARARADGVYKGIELASVTWRIACLLGTAREIEDELDVPMERR
ncbi:hypothetical protein K525DRAFT_285633 [Schizophyllum commune Loenen D]|nr:hypothetical protein K525DRAFT_285633 [Schizophyllum commune Loenen D]